MAVVQQVTSSFTGTPEQPHKTSECPSSTCARRTWQAHWRVAPSRRRVQGKGSFSAWTGTHGPSQVGEEGCGLLHSQGQGALWLEGRFAVLYLQTVRACVLHQAWSEQWSAGFAPAQCKKWVSLGVNVTVLCEHDDLTSTLR